MRRVFLLSMVTIGCGSPPQAEEAPPEVTVPSQQTNASSDDSPTPPPPDPPTSESPDVEVVALRFYRALFAGDTQTARELAITLEEMSALTKKKIEREEFDGAMNDFIRPRDPNTEPTEVIRVEVVERGVLKASENEKITRDLEFAMVRPIIRRSGQEAEWMTRPFFKTDHGWKFSPKQ